MTEALRACDPELRQILVSNVVLTGGGSMFTGFADRLQNELMRSFPHVCLHISHSLRLFLQGLMGTLIFYE